MQIDRPSSIAISDQPWAVKLKNSSCLIPQELFWRGNLELLNAPLTAFLCSRRGKAAEILKAYDLASQIRQEKPAVISGFHSPVERDCLKIFLRGPIGVVICPARSLPKRLDRYFSEEYLPLITAALDDGRLLFISPFGPDVKRADQKSATVRNEFVTAIADELVIPYAREGKLTKMMENSTDKCKPVTQEENDD